MAKTIRNHSLSKPTNKQPAFRKYTNMAAVIHLLQTKGITLLDPASWEDKNDAHFMKEYQDIQGYTTVLAICFAETTETYHHWRVFSGGVDGVCIEFDKEALLSAFEGNGIRKGPVSYRLIETLKKRARIEPEELPFLKRKPYEPECEYRVLYVENGEATHASRSFPIELDWIKRITLSPWMHHSLRSSIAKTLRAIPDCKKLRITRSTLVGNREWQALTEKARVARPPAKAANQTKPKLKVKLKLKRRLTL